MIHLHNIYACNQLNTDPVVLKGPSSEIQNSCNKFLKKKPIWDFLPSRERMKKAHVTALTNLLSEI